MLKEPARAEDRAPSGTVEGEPSEARSVYKNYYDIGVAVSTTRGLVVPVVRDADALSLAGIETAINDFGLRARDNKLKIEELQGGTFTISNGGVFGSLMSTPILNAPQSGVLVTSTRTASITSPAMPISCISRSWEADRRAACRQSAWFRTASAAAPDRDACR